MGYFGLNGSKNEGRQNNLAPNMDCLRESNGDIAYDGCCSFEVLMKISVIVPTLNNQTLAATLRALRAQSRLPDEVLVVGRDEVAGVLAGFPEVRFVDTGKPLCAGAVRNWGMREARGDVFLFTDADCVPAVDWVAQHGRGQAVGRPIIGGGIELDNPNFWAESDNLAMFHEFSTSQPAGLRFLLPTLNLSIRRQVWEAVGGMDESFPGAAGEDSDWTIRIRQAGFPLYFDPTAVVQHAPARTRWADVRRHWRTSGHNNIRVRVRYATEYNSPNFAQHPHWLRLLSPLIAAQVTGKIYAQPRYWRYWRSLPVVWATKLIYCWGAAEGIENGFAFG
jgi:GT2 family glycosyltransferase